MQFIYIRNNIRVIAQTEPKRKRSSIKQQTIGKRHACSFNHVNTIKSLSYSD